MKTIENNTSINLNRDLLGIFQNSNKDRIFDDLISYYESTLNAVNFNELWKIYNQDKKVTNKYRLSKPFLSVIADQLRKRVKLSFYVIEYDALYSLISKKEYIENNDNSLLKPKLLKIYSYLKKDLLYTQKDNRVYRVKQIVKENRKPIITLVSEITKQFNLYNQYINDLIRFDNNEIEKIEIISLRSMFDANVKDFWINSKSSEIKQQITTIDGNLKFYEDLEKYALNIEVVSKLEYLRVKTFETKIEDLEFVYEFRTNKILKDINMLKATDEKQATIDNAIFYNKIQMSRYKEITNKPIYLIDALSLHEFYERKKREVINNKKQLYKYCIETKNQTRFKYLNKIELDINRNDKGNIYFKLNQTTKEIKSIMVKIPKKKYTILYINNKSNLIEFLNRDKTVNTTISEEFIPNSYNLVFNAVKQLNIETFKTENTYSNNTVNLIDEYNNLHKYHNRFMEFGLFNNRIDRLSKKRVYTKKGSLKNIQNPPDNIEIERYLINRLIRKDKKRMYPKSNKQFRIIPLNIDTNELRESEKQFKSFIPFFHSFIQKYTVIDGLIQFKLKHGSEINEYIANNPFILKYLKDIFYKCYFPLNNHKTNELNPLGLSDKNREINLVVSNIRTGLKPKVKPKRMRMIHRNLQIRDYIRDNIKNNKNLIDKWFIRLREIDFYNPRSSDIAINYYYISKKHYFNKILSFYSSKVNEFKTALKLNLLNKRDYEYLVNSMKFVINYNKIFL